MKGIVAVVGSLFVLALAGCAPRAGQEGNNPGTITVDGFLLRYRIEGSGPPAVVVGSSVSYPRTFSQNLRKHLRLVFLDHRGYASPPGPVDPSTAYALERLVEDIEHARKALGLGRIIVIGHSGHSYMALEYAKKYPENVSHVVMIGIAPDLSPAGAEEAERYWQESVDPERKAVLEENRRRFPDEKLNEIPAGQRFSRWYVREGPPHGTKVFCDSCAFFLAFDNS